MTEKQQRALDFVRAHYEQHGRGPTIQAVGVALGIVSKSSISQHLNALVRSGHLRRVADSVGKYVPAEAREVDLGHASTAAIRAELQRREASAAK